MTIRSLGVLAPSPRRKRWFPVTRRGRERAAVAAGNMTLVSAGTRVPLSLIENDPMLMHLTVDDMCWRLAVEDLDRHRPHRGDRCAQDAWLADRAQLEAERERLAVMVTEAISSL
ncbi:hypothetical protein [Catenulispora rubra]|uniref:hypothetical protein n=1 Tax=Catenulispora rubra TaxID=280293 RepID=UPI0018924256|nr:hypothetical protein [Catenulispora rubra]